MYGALLTDLSRAFDCLPPKLLVTKLNTYGVDSRSCMMIANNFCGRLLLNLRLLSNCWEYMLIIIYRSIIISMKYVEKRD